MTTQAVVVTQAPSGCANAILAQWAALTNGNDGDPVDLLNFRDRSVQVTGTFGASGSVQLEGSNDGTNYVLLKDPLGNNLAFTAAGLQPVLAMTRYVRPRVTNGDGTTSLTVTMFGCRS